MDRDRITASLAAAMIAAQFPQWADLPVRPVALSGWDNITYRLGEDLVIRLPSGPGYREQVEKEHRWLPFLAPRLPLSVPAPVATGRPQGEYPWNWSVRRWIPGEPAGESDIGDPSTFAADLAAFLTALHRIDPSGGPEPGVHSGFRGGPLGHVDPGTRESLDLLADEIDVAGAREVWAAATAADDRTPPVWVHGDMSGSNLLVERGRLSAVIDFGCCAVGDPACDLVIAWTFFDDAQSAIFRRGVPVGDAAWARARGWALWKALITLAIERKGGDDADAVARRFGWRFGPRRVVERVISDHARAA